MARNDRKAGSPVIDVRVLRTESLTPNMIRVVCGGEGLAAFRPNDFTDGYVKVLFPVPGVTYPEPFDLETVKAELPREDWPRMRTYTVRSYDSRAGELAIDVVVHGDEGLGGPWAKNARPGDRVLLRGPGGAYAPSRAVDRHVLVGDESALPAIAASVETLPAGSRATVLLLVENPAERQPLSTKGEVDVRWLHRCDGENDDDLVAAVKSLDLDGAVQVFVHGEAAMVRELRRYLLSERALPRELVSISGYWRRGRTDEAWRAEKATFMA